jgi:hypothetical protein
VKSVRDLQVSAYSLHKKKRSVTKMERALFSTAHGIPWRRFYSVCR